MQRQGEVANRDEGLSARKIDVGIEYEINSFNRRYDHQLNPESPR